MTRTLLLSILLPAALFAQSTQKKDVWEPLKFLVGTWEGTGNGQPGTSTIERKYEFVLNGKFLRAENKSTYAPQEKNPKGEIHTDVGYFSYDKSRKLFVLRQFHGEGFVNQYVLDTLNTMKLVFVSEAIENIPKGWRARETYAIVNDHEFTETFELAEPGKEFEVYSEGRFNRKEN